MLTVSRNDLLDAFIQGNHAMHNAWRIALYDELVKNEQEPLSPGQIGILMVLKSKQPIAGSELAAEMRITRSAVTQMLDTLFQQGYIDRQPDPKDRRVIYLSLSNQGAGHLRRIDRARIEVLKKMTARLTDAELEALVAINQKILKTINPPIVKETL